jgi:hypothetical protein
MSCAVDLHHKHLLAAHEVGHEGPDWLLSNELESREAPVSQAAPQARFGRRALPA